MCVRSVFHSEKKTYNEKKKKNYDVKTLSVSCKMLLKNQIATEFNILFVPVFQCLGNLIAIRISCCMAACRKKMCVSVIIRRVTCKTR